MLIDVVDDLVGDVVADALAALAEEADFGRGDVVLDQLRNNADVLAVLLKANERVVCGGLVSIVGLRTELTHQCQCRCAPR